jgi:hypothetical protein
MKNKIKVKYITNEFTYKNWNSKNSQVITKKVAPIVQDEVVVIEDAYYTKIKNSKYSVCYNKKTKKAEVSQFLSALQSKSPIAKSRFIKEVTLEDYQVEELKEKFLMVETL